MYDEANSDAAAILSAGADLAIKPQVLDVNNRPFLIVPEGVTIEDKSDTLPFPLALRQRVTADTPQALTTYLTEFGKNDLSMVFVDRDKGEYTAVLDYHRDADNAKWCRHRVTFTLKETPEWSDWKAANKKAMNQAEFAQFVEDHIPEIADPVGATLMQIVMDFEAKRSSQFSSTIRLSDGSAQFTFNEEVQGTQKGGQIKVPTTFKLVLAPYVGTEPVEMTARLRYRLATGGALALWFDILRLEQVRQAAVDRVTDNLSVTLRPFVRAILAGGLEK